MCLSFDSKLLKAKTNFLPNYLRHSYSNDILSLCKHFYLLLELQGQIEARIMIVNLLHIAPILSDQFQAHGTNRRLFVTLEEVVVQIIHAFIPFDVCFNCLFQRFKVISSIIYFIILGVLNSNIFAHFDHFHCIWLSLYTAKFEKTNHSLTKAT